MRKKNKDICVVGGCGHVGLPLAICFAEQGLKVDIYDINQQSVDIVNNGTMPFLEKGCDKLLKKNIDKNLHATTNPNIIAESTFVIIVIGTPVDEFLNPDRMVFKAFIDDNYRYFSDGQTLILRSTVYPGTSDWLHSYLKNKKKHIDVSFCPERIAEGKAIEEIHDLPQIVSSYQDHVTTHVTKLFKKLTKDIIVLDPIEAELAKLYTNSWRYIQFAIANQFYMLANGHGKDFYKIYRAMTFKYPRTQNFPKAGFAAGPCLFKDTMQLSSFDNNKFFLGHSAMLVNEGMPAFIVEQLQNKFRLKNKTVGILGMAFKAESDDPRSSLSYKLKKLLSLSTKKLVCSDEYIKNKNFVSKEDLINHSDIIILGVPHKKYENLKVPKSTFVYDIWDFLKKE
jgi:UDP-N-acetyl-D-mannosaminuronic acid dehydrogenase